MNSCTRCCISLAVLFSLFFKEVNSTRADAIGDMAIMQFGHTLGGQIGSLAKEYGELQGTRIKFKVEIERNRRIAWSDEASETDRRQAIVDLARALRAKDYYYVALAVAQGPFSEHSFAIRKVLGDFDGDITPIAKPYFDEWSMAIREALGVNFHGEQYGGRFGRGSGGQLISLSDPSRMKIVLKKAENAYNRYQTVRNWQEYNQSGQEALYYGNTQGFLDFWLWYALDRERTGNPRKSGRLNYRVSEAVQQVRQSRESMEELFGKTTLNRIAKQLFDAKKTPNGYLVEPTKLGFVEEDTSVLFALRTLLERDNARAALVTYVWELDYNNRQPIDFVAIEKRIGTLMRLYGTDQLVHCADLVRNAERGEGMLGGYKTPYVSVNGKRYLTGEEAYWAQLDTTPLNNKLPSALLSKCTAIRQRFKGRKSMFRLVHLLETGQMPDPPEDRSNKSKRRGRRTRPREREPQVRSR